MTFLDYVNAVLAEVNEVALSPQQLNTARGLHLHVKNSVNRAYLDIINTPEAKWPWLQKSDSQPQGSVLSGERSIPTVLGQEWYMIPVTDPYKDVVDWENIYLLNDEGNKLDLVGLSWPEYQDLPDLIEGEPRFVVQSADGKSLGIVPVPQDKTYTIKFRVWERPSRFKNFSDVVPIPEQFSNVLIDGATHYVWRFRENLDQANFSFQKFERGVKDMKRNYGNQSIRRLRWR